MKNWLGFGDLDLIFKMVACFKLPNLSQKGLSAWYLMNQLADFNQICMYITLGHNEDLIRFWWPWPNFQGQGGTLTAKFKPKNVLARMLSHEPLAGMLPNLHVSVIKAGLIAD